MNTYQPECIDLDSNIKYENSGNWKLKIINNGSTLGKIDELSINFVSF